MTNSTPHHRAPLLGIVAALWLVALAVKGVVRPMLGPHAPDWLRLLLSSTPSLVGGLTVPLCFLAVHPSPGGADVRRACAWSLAVVIVAEVLERFLLGSTFDWFDLAASVLGVAAVALLAGLLLRVTTRARGENP